MENKVANVTATPDPTYGQIPAIQRPDTGAVRAAPSPEPVDLRLVIEDDQASGSYIYKVLTAEPGKLTDAQFTDITNTHFKMATRAADVVVHFEHCNVGHPFIFFVYLE